MHCGRIRAQRRRIRWLFSCAFCCKFHELRTVREDCAAACSHSAFASPTDNAWKRANLAMVEGLGKRLCYRFLRVRCSSGEKIKAWEVLQSMDGTLAGCLPLSFAHVRLAIPKREAILQTPAATAW